MILRPRVADDHLLEGVDEVRHDLFVGLRVRIWGVEPRARVCRANGLAEPLPVAFEALGVAFRPVSFGAPTDRPGGSGRLSEKPQSPRELVGAASNGGEAVTSAVDASPQSPPPSQGSSRPVRRSVSRSGRSSRRLGEPQTAPRGRGGRWRRRGARFRGCSA